MAVLVCGVGYIGAALAGELLAVGEQVIGFDDLSSTDRRAIHALERHGAFQLVEGDLADPESMARAFDAVPIETAFLLAGQSSSDDRMIQAEQTERANLRGPRVFFDACEAAAVERVVFGSSLRVYGQPLPDTFDEQTAYGTQHDLSHLSKIYGEKLLELYAARRPMRAVAARLAIVYGLGPVMKRESHRMTVPNRFALQARHGAVLRAAAGVGYLSLLHLQDAAGALIRLADRASIGYEPINVLGDWHTLADLVAVVRELAATRGLAVAAAVPDESFGAPPCGRSRLDRSGFERRRDLRSGVRELLDYFLADQPRSSTE